MRFKKIIAALLLPMIIFLIGGCLFPDKGATKIGVAMPTRERQRWNQDGANIERGLLSEGYRVDLQYADNNVEVQIEQIKNMVDEGCRVLIVAAIDGRLLSSVLDYAKKNGATVISYDRLIMDTDAIDYYATFDNLAVGTIQGEYIEEKLGLREGKGPYNLEITAGSLDDNNTIFFFEGAMEVLRPYIKTGQLVVNSGQTKLKQCEIPHWKEKTAEERLTWILQTYYGDKNLDVALCANDSTARGVLDSLKKNGYGSEKKFPLVTGQDCDKKNLKEIVSGEQTMSIFKDTRILAAQVVKMVDAIVVGKEPETNDMGNYNNGVKIVPSFLVRPIFVDKDNYRKLLIESGYYRESDFNF